MGSPVMTEKNIELFPRNGEPIFSQESLTPNKIAFPYRLLHCGWTSEIG